MQALPNQIVYVVSADGSSQSVNAQAHFPGMLPIFAPKAKAPINKLWMYGSLTLAVLGISLYWGSWFLHQSNLKTSIAAVPGYTYRRLHGEYDMGYGRGGRSYNFVSSDSSNSYSSSEPQMLARLAMIIVGLGYLEGAALGLFISGMILTVFGLSGVAYALNTSGRKSAASGVTSIAISLYLLQIFTIIGGKWAGRSIDQNDNWLSASIGIFVTQGLSKIAAVCLMVFVCKMKYVKSGFSILAKFLIVFSIWTGYAFPLAGLFEFILQGTFEWPTRLLIISYSLGVAGGIILLICHAIDVSNETRRNAINNQVKSVV